MIGGPASELAYRDDVLSKMERALDLRMAAHQSAAREFAPRLLKESLRFRLTSGLEASGHNTPRPGQGVVFDTELKIAEGYRNASEMTSTYLHSAHEVWASAKEAVRKTRSGIFDPAISRADADKAMQAVAATVSRQLAHMEDFDPLEVPQGLVHVMVQVPQRGITEVDAYSGHREQAFRRMANSHSGHRERSSERSDAGQVVPRASVPQVCCILAPPRSARGVFLRRSVFRGGESRSGFPRWPRTADRRPA